MHFIPNDRFAEYSFERPIDYVTLVNALLEAADACRYKARIEEKFSDRPMPSSQKRTYSSTDIRLTGTTLMQRAVTIPLIVRLYNRDSQKKIGVYMDDSELYYGLFPIKFLKRSLERYADALMPLLDELLEKGGREPPQPSIPSSPQGPPPPDDSLVGARRRPTYRPLVGRAVVEMEH